MSDLKGQIEALVHSAVEAQDTLAEKAQAISSNVDIRGNQDRALMSALSDRDIACLALGRGILQWVLSGYGLDLTEDLGDEVQEEALVSEPVEQPLPPTPTVEEPVVEAVPATAADVNRLITNGIGSMSSDDPPVINNLTPDLYDDLEHMLATVGDPGMVVSVEQYQETLDGLWQATNMLPRYSRFPNYILKPLMGYLSSKARHLQDEVRREHRDDLMETTMLLRCFGRMTEFSTIRNPGLVPGLNRARGPHRNNWVEDQTKWWNKLAHHLGYTTSRTKREVFEALEGMLAYDDWSVDQLDKQLGRVRCAGWGSNDKALVDMLMPHYDAIPSKYKTLRSAVRDALVGNDGVDPTPSQHDREVPDDWPLWDMVAGKRAIIVGGSPRQQRVAKIKAAFKLGDLEWVESRNQRKMESTAQTIISGNVDIVLFLRRFTSHTNQNLLHPVCKEAGSWFVLVDTGYGVNQIRMALERYMAVHMGEE